MKQVGIVETKNTVVTISSGLTPDQIIQLLECVPAAQILKLSQTENWSTSQHWTHMFFEEPA